MINNNGNGNGNGDTDDSEASSPVSFAMSVMSPTNQLLSPTGPVTSSPHVRTLVTSPRQSISTAAADVLAQRYIQQLLYGCPRHGICDNAFCASNPALHLGSTTEIATLAAQLASMGSGRLCPHFQADASTLHATTTPNLHSHDTKLANLLTLGILVEQIIDAKQSQNWSLVMRQLFSIFSSTDRLTASFPAAGDIKQAYHIITTQCPQAVTAGIMSAISTLLDRLQLVHETLPKHLLMDILIKLLDHPSLLDATYHPTVISKLSHLLATLPMETQQLFQQHWINAKVALELRSTVSRTVLSMSRLDKMRREAGLELMGCVAIFQHFLTLRIYTITGAPTPGNTSALPNKDSQVQDATRTLALFQAINDQFNLISFEEFYNEAVNESLEIKEDFPHWKAKDGFSFCNYPFILNPATKTNVLKIECMVQMRHELQDAFFRAMFVGVNSPYLVLEIRRQHIIRDALVQLEAKSQMDLKKQLKVQFVGEEAVDEGGVGKEFFQLVVRDLFDPRYGLFVKNEESGLYWFAPNISAEHPAAHPRQRDHQVNAGGEEDQYEGAMDKSSIEEVRLVGKLIGLAIYNAINLDVQFPLALYKKLLESPPTLSDLTQLDTLLGKNLEMMLEYDGDVESTFGQTFQVNLDVFGQVITCDLKPGGADIPLTNANCTEFVELYVDFLLNRSVSTLFTAFKEGFEAVTTPKSTSISLFRPEELELLVCGSKELDFYALEKVTTYDGGFTRETPVVSHFWQIVHTWSTEQQKKLLFFTTGTDRVPIGGLGKMTFVIAKNGPDSERLPSSHTCFNVLLLPEYAEKHTLEERLLTAIQNSEGFGMI